MALKPSATSKKNLVSIRYKKPGPSGPIAVNVDGEWREGDEKDVPEHRAKGYLASGQFESGDKKSTSKKKSD